MRHLILKGVRQNNLKDVDVSIPLGQAVVVTGPSGSGKSSLAFETIYAEGQRRYMQSLSTYARQFLEKFKAPDVDKIENIPPTIALEQFNPVRNSRATVGTTTEIYDYLRLLFEKIGIEHCEFCNVPMEKLGFPQIFDRLQSLFEEKTILLTFSRTIPAKAEMADEFLKEMLRGGYSRLVYNEEVVSVEEVQKAASLRKKKVEFVVDRIRMPKSTESDAVRVRLIEAARSAMELGLGTMNVLVEKDKRYLLVQDFTNQSRCPKCRRQSPPKTATSFSFNSPLGACANCNGFGNTLEVDREKVVPNPNLSVSHGAIDPFTKPSLAHWQKKLLAFCKENDIDTTSAFKDLPQEHQGMIFNGTKKFKGVRGVFQMLEKDKYKMRIRVFLSRYNSPFLCQTCNGARLNAGPLRVRISELNIAECCDLTLEKMHHYLKTLPLSDREKEISQDILRQVDRRLDYLNSVGLGYLTLSSTLR